MEFNKKKHNSVIEYVYKDFGIVCLMVHKLMDMNGLTVNKMSELSGIQHRVVKKYYEQKAVRIDLETLAKFCFVLKCDIADILCYNPPTENENKR